MLKHALRLFPFALWALLSVAPLAARAGEGRIELNHVSALSGDASLGDQAGYPVTLRLGTSFVLTGPLTPPAKTNAIEIQAHGVHIDLGGHAIAGTASCAPGACSATGDAGISIAAAVEGSSIANGSIRGFGGDCLRLGGSARVRDLHVFDCGEDGIEVGAGSDVHANTVQRVARHGIHFAGQTGTYAENVVSDMATSDPTGVSVSRGYNCNNWTTGDNSATGLRIILRFPTSWNLAGTQLAPWQASAPAGCGAATNVWCIED
jgi:hypothetical protein